MKKTIVAILSLTILCLAIYSCQKEKGKTAKSQVPEKLQTELAKAPASSGPKLGWLPDDSEVRITDAGAEVTPPAGWLYAGYNTMNGFFELESGATKTISCTCNVKGGECLPFTAKEPFKGKKTQGCFGTCTDCTMKQSAVSNGVFFGIQSGGYFSSLLPTRILKDGESAPAIFPALFEVKEFKNEFVNFIRKAYNGIAPQNPIYNSDGSVSAPKGFSFVAISIMGRGMAVLLPDEYVAINQDQVPMSSKVSCSCSGKGTCKVKGYSFAGLSSLWCETTDCTTCTMTVNSLSSKEVSHNTAYLNSYAF